MKLSTGFIILVFMAVTVSGEVTGRQLGGDLKLVERGSTILNRLAEFIRDLLEQIRENNGGEDFDRDAYIQDILDTLFDGEEEVPFTPDDFPSEESGNTTTPTPTIASSDPPSVVPIVESGNTTTATPTIATSDPPTVVPSEESGSLTTTAPSSATTDPPRAVPGEPGSTTTTAPSSATTDPPRAVPGEPGSTTTTAPSIAPTDPPSDPPSVPPSIAPTDPPSDPPSVPPSTAPSDQPSDAPSDAPSDSPSDMPSDSPSDMPSDIPSDMPSSVPTEYEYVVGEKSVCQGVNGIANSSDLTVLYGYRIEMKEGAALFTATQAIENMTNEHLLLNLCGDEILGVSDQLLDLSGAVCGPFAERVGPGVCVYMAGRTQVFVGGSGILDTPPIYCAVLQSIRDFIESGTIQAKLNETVASIQSALSGDLIPTFCSVVEDGFGSKGISENALVGDTTSSKRESAGNQSTQRISILVAGSALVVFVALIFVYRKRRNDETNRINNLASASSELQINLSPQASTDEEDLYYSDPSHGRTSMSSSVMSVMNSVASY